MAQPPRPGRSPLPARLTAKQGLGALVAALAVVFIVQNGHQADIEFLFIDLRMPLWVALSLLFAAGVGAGIVLTQRRSRRR